MSSEIKKKIKRKVGDDLANDNTDEYTFEIGDHTAQAHEYISALIDEAYRRKANGCPTTAQERVESTRELTEAHYSQVGIYPDKSVLSRISWYIVFDEMTDDHPDKMTRGEYPIMTTSQRKRREEFPSKNVYFDKRNYTGFRTVYEKSDDATGYVKKYPVYNDLTDEDAQETDVGIDVLTLLNDAGLTERQREAIELVYFDGMTQAKAGESLGISRNSVDTHIRIALNKIRLLIP